MQVNRGIKMAVAAMVAGLVAIGAQAEEKPYNVAVLPSWKNWQHVHDFDWAFRGLGYTFTNCVETAEQIDWLDKNLEKFDLLFAPPLFHYEKGKAADPEYTRPYNMDKLGPHIAKWIQEGGCFLGVDMNYPMAMEWYGKMDPLMEISACVDPSDMVTTKKCGYYGPPMIENNDPMLYFPQSIEPGFCWGHMVMPPAREKDSAWKVIATCGHGHGFPTLVVRRWGKGIIVLSSTRTYVLSLLQNIRANQRFAQIGITITKADMPNPLPGRNVFSFTCDNASDKPFPGELELTIYPRVKNPDKDPNNRYDKYKPDIVDDPDKSHWFVAKAASSAPAHTLYPFKLECNIPLRGDVHAVMKFRTGKDEAVVFDRMLTLPEFFVLSGPPYRSIVSASRRFKDVTFTSHIYPCNEKIEDLTVSFTLNSPTRGVMLRGSFPAEQGKTYHKVPLPLTLPEGKYTIEGTLAKAGGDVVATSTAPFEIMPNGPAYAAFDEDNTLIVEGEPFLPLGIYHPRDKNGTFQGFKDVADVGFNVVNIFGWMGVSKLDILRPVDAYCLWEQLPHRLPVMCMEQSQTLNFHPSALINYTIDEPAESQFNHVQQLDEAWRKYDPYHPTFLASYQADHFRRNAEISDILAPDPYPYNPMKGEDSDLALVARRVELARAASDGVNPVFCVPQAMGDVPPYIWRNMGLQAIVHGAKGIIWYAWNEGNPGPWGGLVWDDELLPEAEIFLAQLKLLAPAILGNADNQPRMFTLVPGQEPVWKTILGSKNVKVSDPYDDDTVLHGMVCRDPKTKTRYLILVNTSREPFSCELKVDEASKVAELEGAFGDESLAVSNGVVKVSLGKFGSGIWYWDGPKPVMPRPMSDFAVRKLPRRGSGKTFTVAPDGQYTNLQAAIDAARDGDVIKVAEGDWGPIVCDNKLIDIVATGDRGNTFLSGCGGRAATLTQRPQGRMDFETNTLVRGFTVKGGNSRGDTFRPKFGGGVIGGTLVDCVVQGNKARYGGGAAFANIFNCAFNGNRADFNGGGASVCKIEDSLFNGNSAVYDGGAIEFSDALRCTFTRNSAGRGGGAAASGSVSYCKFVENKAQDRGGAVNRSKTDNSLFIRNYAKMGGAGTSVTVPEYCTFAYNTTDDPERASAVNGEAKYCLFVNNTCKGNPMVYQVRSNRNTTGDGNWYASDTNNYPKNSGTFTTAAFVDVQNDDYRLTPAAPFIDSVQDQYFDDKAMDFYGERRLHGGGVEPGVAEYQGAGQSIFDIDVAKGSPLAGLTAAGAPALRGVWNVKTLPTVADGLLSFEGTNAAQTVSSMIGVWPKFRIETEFRARGAGPVFWMGNRVIADVADDGKLRVIGVMAGVSNILSTAESVKGKFSKLVIDIDRFGGSNGVVRAKLDGKPIPMEMPFAWKNQNVFLIGNQRVQFGFDNQRFFTGDIKSFKVTGRND